mmetsp:Transcript_32949/g.97101  ORF Transcript_32949/g.97101 Transcript_32949/m.97101 type:complete len:225 (+) Transcript_32949:654-1328(+)
MSVQPVIASHARDDAPPLSAAYEPATLANAFSSSITYSSAPLFLAKSGVGVSNHALSMHGMRSSMDTSSHSPRAPSKRRSRYLPGASSPSMFWVTKSSSRMYDGNSATAAMAARSQQSPRAPCRMSSGSMRLNSCGSSPAGSSAGARTHRSVSALAPLSARPSPIACADGGNDSSHHCPVSSSAARIRFSSALTRYTVSCAFVQSASSGESDSGAPPCDAAKLL